MLQQRTQDVIILLPIVHRLLIFLSAPQRQVVYQADVRYMSVLLELPPNALTEIRHSDVKRIDRNDFGSLREMYHERGELELCCGFRRTRKTH